MQSRSHNERAEGDGGIPFLSAIGRALAPSASSRVLGVSAPVIVGTDERLCRMS